MVRKENPFNNDEPIVVLEGIEDDTTLSRALDKYGTKESSSESHVSCSLGKQFSPIFYKFLVIYFIFDAQIFLPFSSGDD